MFKRTETSIEELKRTFVETDDLDFYMDYHIAEWYPDSEFIKAEVREKMKEAVKIFTDPAFSQLTRKEKIALYQSRI